MCGIVYYKNLLGEPVNQKVIERYKAQKGRGRSGFGFYLPETDRLVHNPRENRILRLLKRETTATDILMHHRFPTSTTNVRNACHPFSTRANGKLFKHQYVLVHNGVLQNDNELLKEHEKLGIKYISAQDNGRFNDSEALLYDVALYLEGKQDVLNARGSIAFVVVEKDETGKPIKTHFARNYQNPLKIHRSDGKFLELASEGEGVDIDPNQLYTFDYADGTVTKKYCHVPTTTYQYNNNTDWGSRFPSSKTNGAQAQITEYAGRRDTGDYYDVTLTRPQAHSPALAKFYYANGYYDNFGYWHYYEEAKDNELKEVIVEEVLGNDPLGDSSLSLTGFHGSLTEDSEEALFQELTVDFTQSVLQTTNNDHKEACAVTMAALARKQDEFKKLNEAMQANEGLVNDEPAFAEGFNDLMELDDEIQVMKRAVKHFSNLSEEQLVNDFLSPKKSKKSRRRMAKEARKIKVQVMK